MRASRLLGIVVAATMFATVTCGSVAGAANLGPQTNKTLGAWVIPGGTGAPNVVTWANFTGVTGTNLSGKALNGPGNWIVGGGTWTIQTNTARSTRVARARMTVNAGTQNAAALATLTFGASPDAGLVALDNGTVYVYAIYSTAAGGKITLYKYSGGAVVLGTVTGVGRPASALMKLDASTTTLKVSFAGTLVLSYTLTAAEIAVFKTPANNRFGLIADNDNATRFDDFHVDN